MFPSPSLAKIKPSANGIRASVVRLAKRDLKPVREIPCRTCSRYCHAQSGAQVDVKMLPCCDHCFDRRNFFLARMATCRAMHAEREMVSAASYIHLWFDPSWVRM